MTFSPTTVATVFENSELNYSVCESELRVTEMIRYDCDCSTELLNRAARVNDQSTWVDILTKAIMGKERNFATFGGPVISRRIRFYITVVGERKNFLSEYPPLLRIEVETVCMEISRELKVTSDRM